jgi:hypothetical protein
MSVFGSQDGLADMNARSVVFYTMSFVCVLGAATVAAANATAVARLTVTARATPAAARSDLVDWVGEVRGAYLCAKSSFSACVNINQDIPFFEFTTFDILITFQ